MSVKDIVGFIVFMCMWFTASELYGRYKRAHEKPKDEAAADARIMKMNKRLDEIEAKARAVEDVALGLKGISSRKVPHSAAEQLSILWAKMDVLSRSPALNRLLNQDHEERAANGEPIAGRRPGLPD